MRFIKTLSDMKFLIYFEGLILILVPIAGIVAVIMEFGWTNLLLLCILLLAWKIANNQPNLPA